MIILVLLSISFASATQNDTVLTNEIDEDLSTEDVQIQTQTDKEELSDEIGGYGELEEAFLNGGTFNFEKDYAADGPDDNLINIKKSIIIDGHGHTIDAKGYKGIFQAQSNDIKNVTVVIKNLIFKNACSGRGGAILIFGPTNYNLKIINCTFIDNEVNNYAGGAIYFSSSKGNLDIKDSVFKNNKVSASNVWDNHGGAIRLEMGSLNVDNSIFSNNYATEYGGSIFSDHGGTITNCSFQNDYSEYGGSIYSNQGITINNCTFNNNTAEYGGAIYSDEDITINNCTFFANSALEDGGAIYTSTFNSAAKELIFIDNKAFNGGAVYINNENTVTFESCYFENNFAKNNDGDSGQGAAIYLDSSKSHLTLTQNIFVNNNGEEDKGVFNCGYYSSITNNWWGTNNPDFNEGYLIEWKSISDNIKHSDDNPLKLTFKNSDSETYYVLDNINLGIKFIDKDGADFTGKLINWDVNFTSDKPDNLTSKIVEDNHASVILSNANLGEHIITAEVTKYKINLSVIVVKIPTSVKINIDDGQEFIYGSDFTIPFTVANCTEVRVVITKNGEIIYNQTSDVDYVKPYLNASDSYYNITIYTASNETHSSSKDSRLFKILKADAISIDPIENLTYGEALTVTFTDDNTKVNLTIYDSDKNVIFTENVTSPVKITTPIGVGKYNVTVIRYADENHNACNHSITFYVIAKENIVIVTVEDVEYGTDANVKITADADGEYVVDVNGTELIINVVEGNGNKTVRMSAGQYYANATFNNNNWTSKITNATFNVNPTNNYDMNVNVSDTAYGENATVKVTVPADATGTINIIVNGKNHTAQVKNGVATVEIPNLPLGNTQVNVTYSGDNNYENKTMQVTIHVQKINIIAADVNYVWVKTYEFMAKLVSENGTALANKTLSYIINGKTLNTITNSEGIAKIYLTSLNVGVYDLEIDYKFADKITKKIKVLPRLIENKNMVIDYDSASFTIKAIGDNGNPIAGEIVKITINKKTYNIKTDKKGIAKLPIKFKPGKYTITSTYKGYIVKNTIKIKNTLKAKKTVKIKKTAKKLILKAKLKWSNGKAIKRKTIKFKFKGKTYKAKTNKKGIAKITIKKKVIKKLKKGKTYKAKIIYKKETVTTKVKVKK